MSMSCLNLVRRAGAVAVMLGIANAAIAAPPVTTGLMVQLDGTTLGASGDPIAVWSDQKTDEDGTVDDNHQDFGNNNLTKQPVVLSTLMPNGSTQKVVSFIRGSVTGNVSSAAESDVLQSRLNGTIGVDPDPPFTGGGDPAYLFNGTAGPADGMSWFIVFKSNITSVPADSTLQSLQTTISSNYAVNGTWSTTYTSDGGGSDPTVPDLFSNVRDSVTNAENHLYGDVAVPPSWYIAGMRWDIDGGLANSRILPQNQVASNDDVPVGAWAEPFGAHNSSYLGSRRNGSQTNNSALDGEIAEVLIYNTELGSADFDAVMNYLNDKYFIGSPAQAGDFDGDGDVDGADFVAWQTNFPKSSGATLAEGDADADGDVDGADFVVWQTNFPFTPAAGASPVPEPGAVMLLGIGIAVLGIGRRRWQR